MPWGYYTVQLPSLLSAVQVHWVLTGEACCVYECRGLLWSCALCQLRCCDWPAPCTQQHQHGLKVGWQTKSTYFLVWKHGAVVKSIALFYPLEDEEMSGCINTPGSVLGCHCKMKLELRKAFESGQTNCFGKLTVETFQNEVLFLWTEADPACFATAWKRQHTKSDIWAKCTSAERYKIPRRWALAPQIYPTIFQKTYAILSKLLQFSGSQGFEMTHDLHIPSQCTALVLASRHFLFPWVGRIFHFGGKPLRVLVRI